MDLEIKKIIIPSKKSKRNTTNSLTFKSNLENYIEISPEYLRYLHGSWVKCVDKETNYYNPGGFVTDVTVYRANLRTPQRPELTDVLISDNRFYIGKDDKNYQSLREFMIAKENLSERSRILGIKEKVIAERAQNLLVKEKNFENRKLEFERLRENILRNKRGCDQEDIAREVQKCISETIKMKENLFYDN
jgi:hypothetical protein